MLALLSETTGCSARQGSERRLDVSESVSLYGRD